MVFSQIHEHNNGFEINRLISYLRKRFCICGITCPIVSIWEHNSVFFFSENNEKELPLTYNLLHIQGYFMITKWNTCYFKLSLNCSQIRFKSAQSCSKSCLLVAGKFMVSTVATGVVVTGVVIVVGAGGDVVVLLTVRYYTNNQINLRLFPFSKKA